jgi:Ni/Fe-hydrogenase subunit HybB-like protein/mono/diheme cytochrome c family protein
MDAPLPASAVDTSHDAIIAPVLTVGPQFRMWATALAAVVAWAVFAWSWQLVHGLGVTNLGRPVYWGLYITNFVFFVGVSHAGTLISAILRIVQAEWRRPITRMAEVITVLVLFFGVGNVLLDLGRPDRAMTVLLHPHLRSPLIWDVSSITVYLMCSSIYLYLPLIPDIALLRDRTTGWRHDFYERLANGWTGAPEQWRRLEKTISIMAIGVIPVAISVHTVVSWVFAMTIQPMWHSSIFGPYFVVGAIFSGIAAIITAMVVVRKVYSLERYLQPVHFSNLGLLLLVMACLWLYFTFAEHLTTWYTQEPNELNVFNAKLFGHFAPLFWAMLVFCFVVPFTILANNRTRTITGTLIASISVNIGMWLERFTIVVPSLSNPRAPVHTFLYTPSWVEWSLMAGCFAAFALLYMGFTKLFPIISIWELPPEAPEAASDQTGAVTVPRLPLPLGHGPARAVPGLARTTLGVVLILAAVPGRASAQEPSVVLSVALPDRPTAGARVFLRKGCGRCHSLGAQAAAGTMVGPDLRRLLVSRTVMDLAGAFWNHAPVMREKMQELKMSPPTLTRDDIADIFVLLTAYRYYEVELGHPGSATSGRRVFVDKGCAGCHDEDLKTGTRVGPGLQKYRGRSSAIFLAQAMWNHSAEMADAMRARSVPWPKFAAREMDDLIAYLQQDSAGVPDPTQYFDTGSPRRGREIFADKQCIACHAVNGKGGRGGPDLGARSGDLVASVATIASVMWNHSPPMAAEFERRRIPRITFSGQEMVDVIAYLYFVNYTTVRAVPARGARLFAEKCATCHSKQAGGGGAPELAAITRFDEPFALTAAMWNHGPAMNRELEKRGLRWPRFDPGEAADLAGFLLSRRTGGPVPDGPR